MSAQQPKNVRASYRLAVSLHGSRKQDDAVPTRNQYTKHNLKPCAYNPLNRQFDFWIGEWEVVTADGANPAGTSKIELILGDCVIQENWTNASIAYDGKSYLRKMALN